MTKERLSSDDLFYYFYLKNEGNQDRAWENFKTTSANEKILEEAKKMIAAREEWINDGTTPGVEHCCAAYIGEKPGTVGCDILKRLKSRTSSIGMLEWVGNLSSFNLDCILVDQGLKDEEKLIDKEWLHELAKKHGKGICTVRTINGVFDKTDPVVGPQFGVEIWDSKTGYYSVLFGDLNDCWEIAAKLSCMAFTCSSDKTVDFFFATVAREEFPLTRCLAVPGNAGCGTNKLIKNGWMLADSPEDLEKILEEVDC